jgi:predicted neuraminidase
LCKNTLNIKTYCKSKYEIFDLQGRKIIKGNLNNNDNIIDLSNLNKGQYIIKVINADKQYTKQISVIK